MKVALHSSNRLSLSLSIIFFVALTVLVSCKRHDDDLKVAKGEAKIKLINAAPNKSAVDFYIDGLKVNPTALAFGESSNYIKIESGTKITKVNKDIYSEFNYVPTLSYTSFFIEDKAGKGAILTFEDNLGAVETDKIRIKFINLSPNFTNAININLPGGVLLVNSLAFKSASGYFTIDPNTTISVSVLGTGTVKTALGSEFVEGKIYTIWLSGSSNATISINKITYN